MIHKAETLKAVGRAGKPYSLFCLWLDTDWALCHMDHQHSMGVGRNKNLEVGEEHIKKGRMNSLDAQYYRAPKTLF